MFVDTSKTHKYVDDSINKDSSLIKNRPDLTHQSYA